MFRRLERLAGAQMAPGYTFLPDPNEVAKVVLSKEQLGGVSPHTAYRVGYTSALSPKY